MNSEDFDQKVVVSREIDESMLSALRDAYSYGAASTIRWAFRRLALPLDLDPFSISITGRNLRRKEEFMTWAEDLFPGFVHYIESTLE